MKYLLILIAHNFFMSCGQNGYKVDISLCTEYKNEQLKKQCLDVMCAGHHQPDLQKECMKHGK